MAIDLDALRAKHEQLNKPAEGGGDFINNFYKIPEGSNLVRIMPWKDEESQFYAETKIHRVPKSLDNLKEVRNVHCRKVHGEACPMCDLYFGLWKTGKQEDEGLARVIKPRARYYMNILDRETEEVKILSIGVMLFNSIIGAILDDDYGDITDVETGHDFKIVKMMEGEWPKYDQSQPRPKETVLGTKKEIATAMDSLHEIHELVKLEDYEEVKKMVSNLIGVPLETTQESEAPKEDVSDDDYLKKLQG